MSDAATPSTIAPTAIVGPPATVAVPAPERHASPSPEASRSSTQPTDAKSVPDEPAPDMPVSLWMTDRDIVVFTALGAVVLVLLVARWGQLSGWGRDEIEIERLTPITHAEQLDLNRATWVELSQLDGVGEALAVRIVENRDSNGPFRSVDDLDRVKGIGPRTIDRLRPYLKANAP